MFSKGADSSDRVRQVGLCLHHYPLASNMLRILGYSMVQAGGECECCVNGFR